VQKKIGKLVLFFLLTTIAFSQQISLSASVDNSQVQLNDNVAYTIKVIGLRQFPFRLPKIPNFTLLNPSPTTQQNVSVINGSITQSISYTYYLKPDKLGKLIIPALNVAIENKTYTINAVEVMVLKSDGLEAFLRTTVSNSKPYVNEEVTLRTILYVKNGIRLSQVSLKKVPTITGVWKESYEMTNIQALDAQVIDGVSYNTYLLSKDALFPTKAGKVEIESAEIVAYIQKPRTSSQRRSIFNDPFGALRGGNMDQAVVKAPARTITVQDVPNTDADFSGFVGRLKLNAKLDKNEFKTNDGFKLTLTFNGTGNIQTLKIPDFYISSDIERYDPAVQTSVKKDGAKINGRKTIEYVLVPRIAGEQKIGPIVYSFLNSQTNKLEKIEIPAFVLDVKEGKSFVAAATGSDDSPSKKALRTLEEDIRYIKSTSSSFTPTRTHLGQQLSYLLIYPLVLILFFMFNVFMKRKIALSGNIEFQRKKGASSKASKLLKQAKAFQTAGEAAKFFQSIHKSITQFIADKSNTSAAGFTSDQLETIFTKRGVDMELQKRIWHCLETCDFYRYSNPEDPTAEMQKLYDEADEALSDLMKVIK
jgi:hypothetical protein